MHTGAAAGSWGQDTRAMRVRPALSCNYELLMHNTDMQKFVLELCGGEVGSCDEESWRALMRRRLECLIDVLCKLIQRGSQTTRLRSCPGNLVVSFSSMIRGMLGSPEYTSRTRLSCWIDVPV